MVYNTTTLYNASCLQGILDSASSESTSDPRITPTDLASCSNGGQIGGQIEEGISYVAGNTLWAFYQFTVVIVLLSILRARMVNTYHRIFKEADVQWKFFR